MASSPDKHLLKKPSASIYIENDKISQLARKSFNFLLKKAQPDMLTKSLHTVALEEFRSVVKTKSNTQFLKDTLEDLSTIAVTWNYTNRDNKNVWGTASLIADAEIIDNKIIEYSFSEKMRRLLHRPNIYALIDLRVQGRITSKYTLALYEMAVDQCRMKDGCGETTWYPLKDVYVILGVAKNSKYRERYNNFKSQILDKAVNEVNEKTEYTVSYKTDARSRGKSITHIKFFIVFEGECVVIPPEKQLSEKPALKNIDIPEDLLAIVPPERHQEIDQVAKEILRDYKDPAALKFYLKYAKKYKDKKGQPAKNWGAVIRMALGRNEYEVDQEKAIRQERMVADKKEENRLKGEEFKKTRDGEARRAALIASLTEKEYAAFEVFMRLNDPIFQKYPNRKIVDGTKMRNIDSFMEHLKQNPVHKPDNQDDAADLFPIENDTVFQDRLQAARNEIAKITTIPNAKLQILKMVCKIMETTRKVEDISDAIFERMFTPESLRELAIKTFEELPEEIKSRAIKEEVDLSAVSKQLQLNKGRRPTHKD